MTFWGWGWGSIFHFETKIHQTHLTSIDKGSHDLHLENPRGNPDEAEQPTVSGWPKCTDLQAGLALYL